MICQDCGGEVLWVGPPSNLTHTEYQWCGGINNQVVEQDDNEQETEGKQDE